MLLRETANLKSGETVLIQGAGGGVGTYAIQLAKLLGAGKIIGATSSEAKFDKVLAVGADHVIDYTADDWTSHIEDVTNGQGVDVILEMNGGDIFAQSLNCLAPFGRIVVYGMASRQPLKFDDESIVRFFYNPSLNQSIHVFNLGLWFGMQPQQAGKAMGDLIGYVASGQVQVQVDTVLPLSQAADAHRMIEARQTTGKVILQPWVD